MKPFTKEAMKLYAAHLKEDTILAFLTLEPVVNRRGEFFVQFLARTGRHFRKSRQVGGGPLGRAYADHQGIGHHRTRIFSYDIFS